MPTAIVGIKIGDGFVIAADGLSGIVEDDGTFKTTSCQVQKIFRLDAREKHLTWSLSGNADIRSDDGAVVAIDLIETIGSITKKLLEIDGVSLNAFMDGIARCLNEAMRTAKKEGKFSKYPENNGGEICRLFIQGYCNGRPEQSVRRFFHSAQILQEPENKTESDIWNGIYLNGSKKIFSIIEDANDPRLPSYKIGTPENTLDWFTRYARKCIEAHMTDEARAIDNAQCRAIGGRIHIATITKENSVQWVSGFAPIDEKVY